MMFLGKTVKNRPFFVAEIGAKFESYQRLKEIVDAAKQAGADFCKIQYYTAEELVKDNGFEWEGKNLFQLYKESEFPKEWLADIFAYGLDNGIPVFSSVYSIRGLLMLEGALCPGYKISSFENQHIKLLKAVSDTNKPWVMSIGMLNDEQLEAILDEVYPHILLHCVSKYPCPPLEAKLGRIQRLAYTNGPLGYSDHTSGGMASIYATILGACMIERHFAIYGGDSFTSNPLEFKILREVCVDALEAIREIDTPEPELYKIKEQRMLGKQGVE